MTAPGDNLHALWQRLMAGSTAIRPFHRFPVDNYKAKIAACIEDLTPSPDSSMMHTLLNRLFMDMGPVPLDSFLITATTKAGIDNLELLRRGQHAAFRDVLLSSLIDIVSQKLGLRSSGFNVSAACASSTIAVARGAALISSGKTEAVLIFCGDLVTEFIFSGFSALKALSPIPCMPFDRNRNGLSLGEGAAALLLMSAKRARQENRRCLGTILGWGVANDATHITAPAKTARGLVQAINHALETARCRPHEIAAISAHGTGTIYNDLMELTAIQQIFGEVKVPVYSVKGAIGHTLGAAGGIEVVLGLKTLSTQIVPPTVGMSHPEYGARGQVMPQPQSISGDYLLTTNSGFGGVNAALILGK
ncbi:MAG: beta-ketoacyl-[acyl-carrier-protein] synthase family protein [Desulfobacterales bacterium]|nr:beta-ketoacyl-[acyl-carrier-protein] synthase family protein [Desulfobacterales bacterium]